MLQEYILQNRWTWDHQDAPLAPTVRQRADMVRLILSDCSEKAGYVNNWGDGCIMVWPRISAIPVSGAVERFMEKARNTVVLVKDAGPAEKVYYPSESD